MNGVGLYTIGNWADGCASFGVVPKFVLEEWGIDLEKERAW